MNDSDQVSHDKVRKAYKRIVRLLEKQLLEEKFTLEECDILMTNLFLNFLSNSVHNIDEEKVGYIKFRMFTLSAGVGKVIAQHKLEEEADACFKMPFQERETTETLH